MPRSKTQQHVRTIFKVLIERVGPSEAQEVLDKISSLNLDVAGLRWVAANVALLVELSRCSEEVAGMPPELRDEHLRRRMQGPQMSKLSQELLTADFKLDELHEFGPNRGGRPLTLKVETDDLALMREVARLRRGHRPAVLGACKRLVEKQGSKYGQDVEALRRRYRRAVAITKR